MLEIGNIQNAAHNEHYIKPTQNGISNSTKPTAKETITDDDTTAAVTRNTLQAQTEYIQQDKWNTNARYSQHSESGLEQIPDIEQNIKKLNTSLEIGKFLLAKVHEEVLKALRCQGNPDPERVLHLLKDNVTEQNTIEVIGESIAPIKQNISKQSSESM